MDTQLDGRRVLITGAAGGIGAAVVRALAAEGASPVLHCHTSRAAAAELAASLDVSAQVVQADLRDEAVLS